MISARLRGNYEDTRILTRDFLDTAIPSEIMRDVDLFRDMVPLKITTLFLLNRMGKISDLFFGIDFNELVSVGKGASVRTYILYKILKNVPNSKSCRVVCCRSTGRSARPVSFCHCSQECSADTNKIISSWILDENTKSKAITDAIPAY